MSKEDIKEFWEKQSSKRNISHNSISNLESSSALSDLKIQIEKDVVMKQFTDIASKECKVLDLGAGSGQWAFRFSQFTKEVHLVEFSEGMLNLAKNNYLHHEPKNCFFYLEDAQSFLIEEQFDLIWISGLLIYLEDKELDQLLGNCSKMIKDSGQILLRDGTALKDRYEIRNKYSESLKLNYSAIYRTKDEYIKRFNKWGFSIKFHSDMFEENSPLNKWKETRLRIYNFKKE